MKTTEYQAGVSEGGITGYQDRAGGYHIPPHTPPMGSERVVVGDTGFHETPQPLKGLGMEPRTPCQEQGSHSGAGVTRSPAAVATNRAGPEISGPPCITGGLPMPDQPPEEIRPRTGIELLVDARRLLFSAINQGQAFDAHDAGKTAMDIELYLDDAAPGWRTR